MDFGILIWLFAAAVTLHNAEEALLLPKWSQAAGRWYRPVGACEFRFAVIVLTALLYTAALLAVRGGKGSIGAYLISGYALAMFLNVFTHVVPTIVMRRYAPGTATAVLLNLPATSLLLREAIGDGHVERARFLWVGPLVVAALLVSTPVLFAAGRGLCGPARRAHDSTHA